MIKNVLIIDTDEMFISKINGFLSMEPGIESVLTVATFKEGIKKIFKDKPDMVLIDMMTPDINGIDAISKIIRIDKSVRILITTDCYNIDYCNLAFEAGADAFIDKNNFAEDIFTILKAVPKSIQYMFEKYLLSKN